MPPVSLDTVRAWFPGSTPLPRLLWILVLGALLSAGPVSAQDDLYAGIVPVQGQGEAERRAALPEALRHVLRKLSGERELPPDPALDEALAGAANLVLAFGYREDALALPDGTEQERLLLVANFAPPAVDQVVRDLGLRRWRPARQPVVLWVVIDDRADRTLMPPAYQYELDHMRETAEYRGLPVAWPGLSPELMAAVDVQLLWGGYTEQLIGDGSNTEGVAIVAARREGAEWNVRWTYADPQTSSSWRTRAPDLVTAFDEGAHQLVDLVASINAIGPAGQGVFRSELLLTGLTGSGDYARCLAYFEGLTLVDAFEVRGIGPSGLRLGLTLNADPVYLADILRQDGVLEAGSAPGEYRFVR